MLPAGLAEPGMAEALRLLEHQYELPAWRIAARHRLITRHGRGEHEEDWRWLAQEKEEACVGRPCLYSEFVCMPSGDVYAALPKDRGYSAFGSGLETNFM